MREQDKRKIENVRLVRMPDGSLVMKKNDEPKSQSAVPHAQANINKATSQNTQKISKKNSENKKAKKQDIDDVWQEQIRIKEESERLELEYKIAKKMTKDLKRKLRENEQPYDSADPAFQDLLSPEFKDFGKKLQPHASKVKEAASDTFRLTVVTVKKWIKFSRVFVTHKLFKSKKSSAGSIALVVFIISGVVVLLARNSTSNSDVKSATSVQDQIKSIPINQTPDFEVLKPADKSIENLGGFAKISPANSASAYAYIDRLEDTNIKVTQQELPEKFKKDTNIEVEKMAKDFNAKRLVQIDQTILYLGESDKGPQTGIFTKDGLLVFVTADNEIPDVAWVQYITELKK